MCVVVVEGREAVRVRERYLRWSSYAEVEVEVEVDVSFFLSVTKKGSSASEPESVCGSGRQRRG